MKKTIFLAFAALCVTTVVNAQTDTTGAKDSTVADSAKKVSVIMHPAATATHAFRKSPVASYRMEVVAINPAEAVLRKYPSTFAKAAKA